MNPKVNPKTIILAVIKAGKGVILAVVSRLSLLRPRANLIPRTRAHPRGHDSQKRQGENRHRVMHPETDWPMVVSEADSCEA